MSTFFDDHAACCDLQALNGRHCTCGFSEGYAFMDAVGHRVDAGSANRVRTVRIVQNMARTAQTFYYADGHFEGCDVTLYQNSRWECDCGFDRGVAYLDEDGDRVTFADPDKYQTVPLSALEDAKKPLAVKPAQPEKPQRRMTLRKVAPPPKPEPKVTEAKRPPALPNRPFNASDFLTQPVINPADVRPPGRTHDIRLERRPWRVPVYENPNEVDPDRGYRRTLEVRQIDQVTITITGEGDLVRILEDAIRQVREHDQR